MSQEIRAGVVTHHLTITLEIIPLGMKELGQYIEDQETILQGEEGMIKIQTPPTVEILQILTGVKMN